MQIFDCNTLEEQNAFLLSDFPHHRWKRMIKVASALASIYAYCRPGQVPHQATAEQFSKAYHRIFDDLLTKGVAKENFFLQMLLFGKIISTTANPLEAQESVFEKAKAFASECDIRFVHSDMISYLKDSKQLVDFVAFSNITSYFLGSLSNNYLQVIKPALSNDAHVVVRNFLHKATALQLEGYEDLSASAKPIFDRECTRVYTMSLYRKV
jgi:S-adenosylmethionine:diacylglycerol 3-amino-3-carboxypropyl transferase